MLGYPGRPVKGDGTLDYGGSADARGVGDRASHVDGTAGLGGFEVVEAASDRDAKLRRLTVVPAGPAAAAAPAVWLCPACGAATADRHACREAAVADLPLGGWRTELLVRLWQFE